LVLKVLISSLTKYLPAKYLTIGKGEILGETLGKPCPGKGGACSLPQGGPPESKKKGGGSLPAGPGAAGGPPPHRGEGQGEGRVPPEGVLGDA